MGERGRLLGLALGLAFGSLLIGSGAPAGPEMVKVLRTIPYHEHSGASPAVIGECKLETKVPHFLNAYSDMVELVDAKPGKSGRVLELTITEVYAPGGGAWSGPKSMTVKGVLRQNGAEVGNFTARRYSGGGMFAAYKGTCSIVGRCAKAIGKDIAQWLRSPSKDARLGDA